jgi:hypothetical protein
MTTAGESKSISDEIIQRIKSVDSGVMNLSPIIDGIMNVDNYV